MQTGNVFTSASLPLAHRHFNNNRRVGFEKEGGRWSRFKDKLIEIIQTAIRAPTGSPSDGLAADASESSTSTSGFVAAQKQLIAEKEGEDWEINETVINGNEELLHNERDTATGSPFRSDSGGSITRSNENGDGNYAYHPPSLRSKIRWYGLQMFLFFNQRFEDPQTELDFRKLHWYSTKAWAFYGTMFLQINWILYLILNKQSTDFTVYGKVLYYGGLTFFTLPTPFFVATDMPVRYPLFFRIWITIAVWYCGWTETIEMRVCDFFDHSDNTCAGKDFLAALYYTTALPAIMLFVLTERFWTAIAQFAQLVFLLVFVIPVQHVYARNVVSFIIFCVFSQGLHYNREVTERRLYLLNTQLKVAYKAQQKAQNAQFKASQAKRRFASYIFHEVRVPLNNAAIAFNNMTTHEVFKSRFMQEEGMAEDIAALDVSLATVQQVLNDSLDLEKMDAGHFDINPSPFSLHRVIRSILGPISVSAAAKKLDLHIDLDQRIDQLRPSHPLASTTDPNTGDASSSQQPETWVIGDEVRLRQILTNLASNAVKFTPEGAPAGITVKTKLTAHRVLGGRQHSHQSSDRDHGPNVDLERGEGGELEGEDKKPAQDVVVFRLEISDSGPGIKPSDLVDNHLFQPFAQTKVGKLSKNSTGLGLAIVRQIVSLSGGKLGVQSQRGKGATFWIELFYPLAKAAEVQDAMMQESSYSPPTFATTATIAEKERWPAVAFADDVKLPMLRGNLGHHAYSPSLLPSSSPTSLISSLPTPPLLRMESDIPLLEIRNGGRSGSDDADAEPPDGKAPEASPPLSNDSAPSVSKSTSVPAPAVSDDEDDGPLIVLVVDDNSITRTTMARALQKRGCTVYTAQDGKECLDLVLAPGARTYDFISLDNDMPVMTGEEAVKAMREAGRPDIFVVGCTGNALTDDQKRYLEAGADEVLIKPLNFQRLAKIIEIARQRRRQRRLTNS